MTWLRNPRLNSCVDSVALEQPASRLRAIGGGMVIVGLVALYLVRAT